MTRRERYDDFRRTLKGGTVFFSSTVWELCSHDVRARAIWRTSQYDRFHPESDHSYGIFTLNAHMFVWTIREAETQLELTLYLYQDMLGCEFLIPAA